MNIPNDHATKPQLKICGLTDVHEAVGCEELGVDAIGFVFYPKSPRHLSVKKAKEISAALGSDIHKVGVFVNESYDTVMKKVEQCRLTAVQLHGQEAPELVDRLKKNDVAVIKALFLESQPYFSKAVDYDPTAFLVEWGESKLPGGNALMWDWSKVDTLDGDYPLILAGGIMPENIMLAISEASPDAIDVSSGVEFEPGKKNLEKVKLLLKLISNGSRDIKTKKIF